jgi:hypothetical protein
MGVDMSERAILSGSDPQGPRAVNGEISDILTFSPAFVAKEGLNPRNTFKF